MKLKLAIVEDDHDLREGFELFLQSCTEFEQVRAYSAAEGFLLEFEAWLPDVVLMDIQLPGINGIEALARAKKIRPETDVVMLTIYNDQQRIFDSLCAGATGYLLKNTPLAELKAGILSVHAGGSPMSPEIARKVVEHFGRGTASHTRAGNITLGQREEEIVCGLVDGLSYRQIAEKLFISVDTVRFHIKNVYRKLQVNNKADVIRKYLQGEV